MPAPINTHQTTATDVADESLSLARLCERLYARVTTLEQSRWSDTHALQARLDHLAAIKDHEIALLRTQVADRDQIIRTIQKSTAWKLTWPYRATGTLIKKSVRGLFFLLRSPSHGLKALRIHMADAIRSRPAIRQKVHTLLNRLPARLRTRIASAAPPTAQQAGLLPTTTPTVSGAGGEWQWIYDQLRK